MPVQEYIKHLWENEENITIKEIAKRAGVCWRTARKYAHKDDWNVAEKHQRRRPVMDPWADTVDTWLLEDRLLPRKQRRSAAQIFRDLLALGFTGAERTVREFVRRRKHLLLSKQETPYIRLAHPAGEAQADFGVVHVMQDGQLEEMRALTLSFPFSNVAATAVLPSENSQCLCEGLKTLFGLIGGVPQRLRLDNTSAAVTHVGKGESRKLTEMFRRFMLHYRFEAEFCNPARGNEKGHVENKVGYTRRQWMSPPPTFTGFDALTKQLWGKSQKDMQRPHYEKGVLISDLWKQEQEALLPLPAVPFEAVQVDRAVLNKYAQMRWGRHVYEVPQGTPGMPVLLKAFWNRLEVRDSSQQLITTLERIYSRKRAPIDWAAHFINYARRPRAVTRAAMFKHLPVQVQQFLEEANAEERGGRVRLLRDLLQKYSVENIGAALSGLPPGKRNDGAALEQMLYTLDPANGTPPPLPETYTPPEVLSYTPEMSRYNRLQPGGVSL